MHAKRVRSLAQGTLGVMHAASLAVATIGRALATAQGLDAKHTIKQVDRLLSNQGLNMSELFKQWVPYMIGSRQEIVVALDWTEFHQDNHATLVLAMPTSHGRAIPLMWKTVLKSELKGKRNGIEDELLLNFREAVPENIQVTLLADRGFGDANLCEFLEKKLKFEYIIRLRSNVYVTNAASQTQLMTQWLYPKGRARVLRNVFMTARQIPIAAMVCAKGKSMKEAWFLACSHAYRAMPASHMVKLYAKRFSIEETFRDTKDIHFGMGLSSCHIQAPERRDRLLLLSALAIALLTLLGAAAEALGYDRFLKCNTVKRRSHSLFNQGVYFYGCIANMKIERLKPLMKKFGELILQHTVFKQLFEVI